MVITQILVVEGKGQIDKGKEQGALATIAQAVSDTVMMAIAEKKTMVAIAEKE
jgi:hypothetical protein